MSNQIETKKIEFNTLIKLMIEKGTYDELKFLMKIVTEFKDILFYKKATPKFNFFYFLKKNVPTYFKYFNKLKGILFHKFNVIIWTFVMYLKSI